MTQDGSDKSEVKGIISEHDLIVAQANNPGILLKDRPIKFATKLLETFSAAITFFVCSSTVNGSLFNERSKILATKLFETVSNQYN